MITELIHESLKIEGELFLLQNKIDKETNLNEFVKLKRKKNELETRHRQYLIIINDFRRNEAIKTALRRGMR